VGRINQFTGGNHVISFGANFKTSEGFGGFAPIGESTELRLLVEASADNVAATEATIVAKQEGSPENYNVFILYTNDNKAYS
jgi:hypothetical protein